MFEAFGGAGVHGYTVAKPGPSGVTTVRFTMAVVAFAGTPPRPATSTLVTEPAGARPIPCDTPSVVFPVVRVSSRRAGVSVPTEPPAPTKALTSINKSVDANVKMHTSPLA